MAPVADFPDVAQIPDVFVYLTRGAKMQRMCFARIPAAELIADVCRRAVALPRAPPGRCLVAGLMCGVIWCVLYDPP